MSEDEPLSVTCSAADCDQVASIHGLCGKHYGRMRAHGTTDAAHDAVGEPSGYGLYGILTRDETGIQCHECGQWYRALPRHLTYTHGMQVNEYRDRHGLLRSEGLVCLETSKAHSDAFHHQYETDSKFRETVDNQRSINAESHQRATRGKRPKASPGGTARTVARRKPVSEVRACVECGQKFEVDRRSKRTTCTGECRFRHAIAKALATKREQRSKITPSELRARRADLGITLAALAKEVGSSETSVWCWEHGESTPPVELDETLFRLEAIAAKKRPAQPEG